ncbi:hypothetical protein CBFG_01592 [Clostridiales bacterium 1_7_47FAA]|uniref:DarT ssDNA thymidine ADP-ribosyltransferase family protein n=1 Tax=Enterocloster hominis (ex Hitch et al. 2024) TaxID=1917870 RepID=A0ABV1D1E2_9FIRM|nr:hypothetical protein CBFG_01592 [Clostridiales bacterium 1_7_47FAA]
MNDKRQILVSANRRGVEHCVHFTNVLNLPSILSYGLLSKADLEYNWIEYNHNDNLRLDEFEESISVSITSPNYKTFYQWRCDNPSKSWVVLILDAIQILNLDCAFCYTNAANIRISSIPLAERKTYSAFESMFAEKQNQATRQEMKLYPNEPTDPQAEILVFNSIPVSAIQFALFNDYQIMKQYAPLLDNANIPYTRDLGYYYARRDYSFWQ